MKQSIICHQPISFLNSKGGRLDDSKDFIEWAGDYQHYMDLKRELEQKLTAIA
jgi:hypothetical protein